jgi:hypothetical protein
MRYNANMSEETVTVSIRMPRDLYEHLAQLATDEKRSLSKQIIYLLEHALPKPTDR